MGIFDKIKSGAGLDYLNQNQKSSSPKPKKTSNKSSDGGDRELKVMEEQIQKAIKILQEVQEKIRVRRGI